jgi:hypothetical protein
VEVVRIRRHGGGVGFDVCDKLEACSLQAQRKSAATRTEFKDPRDATVAQAIDFLSA